MTLVLARSLVAVFATISLIHLYWALGGRWAAQAVVPQVPVKQGGTLRPAFNPSGWLTLLVALALLMIALLVCLRVGLISPPVTHRALQWLISAIALLLFARAIGE